MRREILELMVEKEVRYASRNRNLLLFLLVVPLVIFPVLILVPPIIANPPLRSSPTLVVNLDTGGQGVNLTQQISQTPGLVLTLGDASSNPYAAVQSGLYDVAVVIPQDFSSIIEKNETATLQVYYDSAYSRSVIAVQLLNGAILSYSQQLAILREPAGSEVPVGLAPTPLQGVRPLTAAFALLLPYLWVIWAAFLGAFLALDMTSAERRESTLPILLAQPYTRFEILSGKMFAITAIGIFAAVMSVAGTYLIPLMGVLIGSGLRDVNVSGTIPLSAGLLGVMALAVGLSFASSAFLLHFLSLFTTGASRKRAVLTGILSGLASAGFLMSTSWLSLISMEGLLPFLGAYTLLANTLTGVASLGDIILVACAGVLFALLFIFLSYRSLVGEGLLLRSYFLPRPSRTEESALPESESAAESGIEPREDSSQP